MPYKSLSAHLIHLKLIFDVVTQHESFVKRRKCEFEATKVEYLGDMINKGVVSMDKQKVSCMMLGS